ncbi:MAG: Hypothetical protein BHV28_00110 [Candidatus Tokpelaia hoelldobleri]|uniref:HdeD family acid-resistance protein n=1 Tax=Candidatus Tokpelaia hoelldobleri TaxID=1902579 RepID=A0A1U9JS69_9HYPH|nr:MAG: Hypothetical protein BHV28_00110 [Candidatus Tokpelaia hoelldoblerii]
MASQKDIKKFLRERNINVEWGWFLALGVILLLFGFVACINLVSATVVSAWFVGIMVFFAGIAQLIHACNVTKWGQFFLWLLAGLLYIAAGIACFFHPLGAAMVITFMLAFTLIAAGIMRIIIGVRIRNIQGGGWVIFGGIITALLGILIIIGWPINSLWILGMFLAIDLIFQGWGWIAFAFGLKSLQK